MNTKPTQLGTAILLCITLNLNAVTPHYVDANGINPVSPYTGWSTAATNIQAAIDASQTGDIIWVRPGVYRESINFGSLNLTLSSTNPADSGVVQATVIQGNNSDSVVTFNGGQTTNTLFTGFTVREGGGKFFFFGGYNSLYGGGIFCNQCSPSIVKNIIEENHVGAYPVTGFGGGIACINASPRIARNIIRNNSAWNGGGSAFINISTSSALVEDNWIYNNTASAVKISDHVVFINNTLFENDLYVTTSAGLVANNIIAYSTPATGLTVATPTGDFSNVFTWFKYNDICSGGGTDIQLLLSPWNYPYGSTNFTSASGSDGNFSAAPLFVDATNFDLHLSVGSPCINAGDLLGLRSTNEVDFDGNSRILGMRVDIGASENLGNGNFPPSAIVASNQYVYWNPGVVVTLNGAASFDPEGAPLTYNWLQIAGSATSLSVSNAKAYFSPPTEGNYQFQLVVNDGTNNSLPVTVSVLASNIPPVAKAGPPLTVSWSVTDPGTVFFNGAASYDPEGAPLSYHWSQVMGSPATLVTSNSQASFVPPGPDDYTFWLVVNDGVHDSGPDKMEVSVVNLPPITSAGISQSLTNVPSSITLDGSHSFDPANQPLTFNWQQTGGPTIALSDPHSPRPTFSPAGPGAYSFELTVSDGISTNQPDHVIFYLGQVPPVADAGPTLYAGNKPIILNGARSSAPNSNAALQYNWSQIVGPTVTLSSTNVAKPTVSGIVQTSDIQELDFELIVKADGLASAPSTVKVFVVPQWSNTALSQINPPFKTNLPTIIAFSGGNCDSGSAQSFPSTWTSRANLFTCSYTRDSASPVNSPTYFGYGDQIMTLLSAAAPGYNQPIQTMGWSTGAMTAIDIAERLNGVYRDTRYFVNRVTLLDSGCDYYRYNYNLSDLSYYRIPGIMFWVDNYYSSSGAFRSGTLNVQFPVPPADHSTPNTWYYPSWNLATPYSASTFQSGVMAGLFFSVIGPGKNYQLETQRSEFHFGWNPNEISPFPLNHLVQMEPTNYPARFPGVVELLGPTNGTLTAEHTVVFSCKPATNAILYQVLIGPDASHVTQVVWEGQNIPNLSLVKLPFPTTWWTIRAFDFSGTSSWSDPRSVIRDSDADGLGDVVEASVYHTAPNNPDTDGDGHLDGQEILAGTDPLTPNPGFPLTYLLLSPSQIQINWFADMNYFYDLESSDTMDPSSWQLIQTFPASTTGGFIQIPLTISTEPARFYRIRAHTTPSN